MIIQPGPVLMTLSEFLVARIAEDEGLVGAEPPRYEPRDMRIEWGEVGAISEVLLIGEARLRAECEAKRRIIELCRSVPPLWSEILRHLALPYADHPDYRDEWAP